MTDSLTLVQPLVLCGGGGVRLWPKSNREQPKQFLPLLSKRDLLSDTLDRFTPLKKKAWIICEQSQQTLLRSHHLDRTQRVLLEPCRAGTAIAVAIGAFQALAEGENSDPLLFITPCDHAIRNPAALFDAMAKAAVAATKKIICFGIHPDHPETGYGYIEAEDGSTKDVLAIRRFREKPDQATAAKWIQSDRYYWNSGMFFSSARTLLGQIRQWAPDIYQAAADAWHERKEADPFTRFPKKIYSACPNLSIDRAVMEKSNDSAVLPINRLGWIDIGSWENLFRVRQEIGNLDPDGNDIEGDVTTLASNNNLIMADDSHSIAVLGLKDMVIAANSDVTLIADRKQTGNIDRIRQQWQARPNQPKSRAKCHRPWGHYQIIDEGRNFIVKRITVDPDGILSLQYHHHRFEHWIVVAGHAHVTKGDDHLVLTPNQSIYIACGEHHRLENKGKEPLQIIEVQIGDILEEEDIVRLEDVYGRASPQK